jgi:hypothetical protein
LCGDLHGDRAHAQTATAVKCTDVAHQSTRERQRTTAQQCQWQQPCVHGVGQLTRGAIVADAACKGLPASGDNTGGIATWTPRNHITYHGAHSGGLQPVQRVAHVGAPAAEAVPPADAEGASAAVAGAGAGAAAAGLAARASSAKQYHYRLQVQQQGQQGQQGRQQQQQPAVLLEPVQLLSISAAAPRNRPDGCFPKRRACLAYVPVAVAAVSFKFSAAVLASPTADRRHPRSRTTWQPCWTL